MTAVLILHCASATRWKEWQESAGVGGGAPNRLYIKCKMLPMCMVLNTAVDTDFGTVPLHLTNTISKRLLWSFKDISQSFYW